MDVWKYYDGRKVFIETIHDRRYSGIVINIDDSSKPLIFITIRDKFDKQITFAHSEIKIIQEERE